MFKTFSLNWKLFENRTSALDLRAQLLLNHRMLQRQGRLLIIDDESELRDVLVALLEDRVATIVEAANGLEALDILAKEKFDAILSDEKMPRKSGLEVLKWLRDRGADTPFIIHSGFSHRDLISEGSRLGVFAIIDKPWDENTLIQTVCDAIENGLAKKL
ncbi:MAG: response regulator [Proteobacteria bacterium]|nr:MAG: response regulator [Pseudomonadota bacterium]